MRQSHAPPPTGEAPRSCRNTSSLASSRSARLSLSSERIPQDEANAVDPRLPKAVIHHMPDLRPSFMWPRRNAKVAHALAALAQIDFVEFAGTKKIHGSQVFVLNVYLKRQPSSRIPTNRASRVGSVALADRNARQAIKPDYKLEKTLNEIQSLRYQSWINAQLRTMNAMCEYCAAFRALLEKHYSNATLLALLWPSTAHRKKVVEGFVNGLVALSVHGLSSLHRTRGCDCFANIPVRLQRFLGRRH